MDFGLFAMAAAAIALGLVSYLAIKVINGGMIALQDFGHDLEQLPTVMGNRYAAFAISIFAAIIYGDFIVVAFLFFGFAVLGLWDAMIYWNAGKPIKLHLFAMVGSMAVATLAYLAIGDI